MLLNRVNGKCQIIQVFSCDVRIDLLHDFVLSLLKWLMRVLFSIDQRKDFFTRPIKLCERYPTLSSLLDMEQRFKRIMGYQQLWMPDAGLKELTEQTGKALFCEILARIGRLRAIAEFTGVR